MVGKIWGFGTLPWPIRRALEQVGAIGLRTWQIARRILANLPTRGLFRSRRVRAREGGCERFVDRRIVSLWQRSLDLATAPNRRGLERALHRLRDRPALGENIERIEHLFDNRQLPPLLAEIFCEDWALNPANLPTDLEMLRGLYNKICARCGDASAPTTRAFDPILFGNLPYTWRKLEFQGGSSALIRMPVITRDIGGAFAISPEFQSYLSALSRKGERHLYVNLMDKNRGREAGRSQALRAWAETNPPGLVLASLDKNSAYYSSGGCSWSKSVNLANLRQTSSTWLMDSKYHQWPFEARELAGRIEGAQERVEELPLFSRGKPLSRADCRTYLDLVQTELLHQLLLSTRPKSTNITCKNCIDRGPCQQVLLASWVDRARDRPAMDISKALLLLVPAWLVSGRAMQRERFERCLGALQVLERAG